jgi:3-ketosteroid 9alpha-monooxygenase subunit B
VSDSGVRSFTLLEAKLDGVTHTLRWDSTMTLVDALLEGGIDVPHSCKAGKCCACVCVISSGAVVMENNDALDERDLAEGYVLGCQARPTTPEVKVEFSNG